MSGLQRSITVDAKIEECCEVMHNAYEKAATGAGWETNPASRVEWAHVPESNKKTMRAAVFALLDHLEGQRPKVVTIFAHDPDRKCRCRDCNVAFGRPVEVPQRSEFS